MNYSERTTFKKRDLARIEIYAVINNLFSSYAVPLKKHLDELSGWKKIFDPMITY